MINLTISQDNVLVIATQEGTQSQHIHRLYSVANQYIPEHILRFRDNHGNIMLQVNSLTELAELFFLFGNFLGLGIIE